MFNGMDYLYVGPMMLFHACVTLFHVIIVTRDWDLDLFSNVVRADFTCFATRLVVETHPSSTLMPKD